MAYTDMTSAFFYKKLLTWQDMDRLAENDAYLLGNKIAPGGLIWWLTATVPDGYVKADGGAVSRTGVGAALFALWGTKYGVGDGSSTFNVLDMSGRIPMGAGAGAGLTVRTLDDVFGDEAQSSDLAVQGSPIGSTDPATAVGTVAATGNTGLVSSQAGANTMLQRKSQSDAFDIIPPVHVGFWIIKL